jgi:two-component system, sensor histidine kinase and response regulator
MDNTLKVLVVDDEPGICSGISRILRNFNVGYPFMDEDFTFDVKEASTGEDALDMIHKDQIDIILLDNKLPGMDGIEVLEQIKKENLDILVMMITSYASLDLAVKATQNGAYNFVPKPFTPQELKSAMENITKHLFLRRMTKDMDEGAKQARFQFLSLLSHELKSPVNAVEGYLRMMLDKQVGDSIDDYKVMIDRSLERIKGMRTLITDLLDLTKIESGQKTRNIQEIDVSQIARKTLDNIEPFALQKNVKLFLDLPDNIKFDADENEMEIIFNNLLSNAIKYNKEEGEVSITIKSDHEKLIIIVEDTGIGMNEEEMDGLFQEFVRIKNSKTKNISGSGLGLSIVRKIVEEYNGKVNVESNPDKGSKFTISMPRIEKKMP